MSTNSASRRVSVIGLGAMGSTLTRLLLNNGYQVTVWNRTKEKADALVEQGAILAKNPGEAIQAGSIIVVCVYDYNVANNILQSKGTADALKGKVLIQLTTGSPHEARESEKWVTESGADYLDGAIQAAPGQMGGPDTPIFVSGSAAAFQKSESVLHTFGGGITWLGESVDSASAMDLATLSYIYGSVLGFFHGVRIAEVSGIDVENYGSLVAQISKSFGDFLKHESRVIQSGDFRVSESPLKISVEATERILQQAKNANISTAFPSLAADMFRKASDAGYRDEEAAALIKVLRAESQKTTN